MKIIKWIVTILVTFILILIFSFNIFNYVSINILDNDLPTINGYAFLEVISGSMEPKINIGDMVIIDTKVDNYKKNDIVTFKDINGNFVTHRIIKIKDNEVITKGDANNTIDDPIDKKEIVGRYIYQIDGIGALMKSLRSPFTLVMILIIGILLCILVSTDSKGNAILTEEEKEYIKFLEFKNNQKKENRIVSNDEKDDIVDIKKTTSKKKKENNATKKIKK